MDTRKPTASSSSPTRFFRAGGFAQLCIESAADLTLVPDLDETLWVATSCPVQGLDLDEATLRLVDADGDGRIRPPELKAAVAWLLDVLAAPASVVDGRDWLDLAQVNEQSEAGARILQAARRVLHNLGRDDETKITLANALDRGGIFAAVKSNGDGVIPEAAAESEETRQVIRDIIATCGGASDRSGQVGVTQDQVNAFYADARAYLDWWTQGHPADCVYLPDYESPVSAEPPKEISLEAALEQGEKAQAEAERAAEVPDAPIKPARPSLDPAIFPLGEATPAAYATLEALRGKIDEFFVQRQVAAFDARAVSYFNFRESDLQDAGGRDEFTVESVMRGLPLAKVAADADLPLADGVNPVYAASLLALREQAARPVLGVDCEALSPESWAQLQAAFQPYATWLGAKQGAGVEKLSPARLGEILRGKQQAALQALIQLDAALAGEIAAVQEVEKLLRYHRDLFRLLNNTVSFPEFYDTERHAIFQAGTMVIDGCSLRLCVEVADANSHAAIAQKSGIYLFYAEAKRKDQPKPIMVCAAMTGRSAGRITTGKNAVFYDRQGRDWDARVTKVLVNPISLREAAIAPFKAIGDLIGGQIEKITQSRQKAIEQQVSGSITDLDKQVGKTPVEIKPDSAAASKGGGIGVGGMLAGGGVAIAALSSSFAYIAQQVRNLPDIYFLYTLLLVLLFVVGPSVLIGFFKLRARDIGMMLEASGWAINGRMRLNLKLARDLTRVGSFPANARRVHYEYLSEDGRTRRKRFWLRFLLIAGFIAFTSWWFTHH